MTPERLAEIKRQGEGLLQMSERFQATCDNTLGGTLLDLGGACAVAAADARIMLELVAEVERLLDVVAAILDYIDEKLDCRLHDEARQVLDGLAAFIRAPDQAKP